MMTKLSENILEKVLFPIILLLLTPLITVLGSKLQTGSWTAWFVNKPKYVYFIFGGVVLLWFTTTLIRKRLKKIERQNYFDLVGPVVIPAFGYIQIDEIKHADVLWKVRAPAQAPSLWDEFSISNINPNAINIYTPPICPKCRTELEEELRFFGGYRWSCIRCGFSIKQKHSYYREKIRAQRLAQSYWQDKLRNKS
jgi:hypothetical protein